MASRRATVAMKQQGERLLHTSSLPLACFDHYLWPPSVISAGIKVILPLWRWAQYWECKWQWHKWKALFREWSITRWFHPQSIKQQHSSVLWLVEVVRKGISEHDELSWSVFSLHSVSFQFAFLFVTLCLCFILSLYSDSRQSSNSLVT